MQSVESALCQWEEETKQVHLGDLRHLVKVMNEVKATADAAIKVTEVRNAALAVWTDSGLYGNNGELLELDPDLEGVPREQRCPVLGHETVS